MFFVYPAIFHFEDGGYWIDFPDVDGCFSEGDTVTDAMANASEALVGHLMTIMDDGHVPPVPSDISAIAMSGSGFVSLVPAEVKEYVNSNAVRKTLTIPPWLNDAAIAKNINFSQTLQEALLQKVQAR